jgi:hypothetical protein
VRYLVTTCLACAVFLACWPGERQVNTYATFEAARVDRLFERGWISDVLPSAAGPIVEAHDLDTNGRCSKSSFPPDGVAGVQNALSHLGFDPHPGAALSLPLSICPFTTSEIEPAAALLSRASPQSDAAEFAVLNRGVLDF